MDQSDSATEVVIQPLLECEVKGRMRGVAGGGKGIRESTETLSSIHHHHISMQARIKR